MEGNLFASIGNQPVATVFFVGCIKKMTHFIVECASLGGFVSKYKTTQVSYTMAQKSGSFAVKLLK